MHINTIIENKQIMDTAAQIDDLLFTSFKWISNRNQFIQDKLGIIKRINEPRSHNFREIIQQESILLKSPLSVRFNEIQYQKVNMEKYNELMYIMYNLV